MPCKGIVLPLSLSARKLSNLKLLYQKLRLLCSLLGKTNLVLTTGFEPATGFLLRITKPVLSAIQPSQHKIGPAVGSLTQDISARSCRPSLSTTGRRPRVDDSIKLVGIVGLEPTTLCSQSRCATRLRYIPFKIGSRGGTRTPVVWLMRPSWNHLQSTLRQKLI